MNTGIALGSNLGDRLENLRQAVQLLMQRVPGTRLTGVSSVYETEPVDCPPGSPGFLNAVIEVHTPLAPLELLTVTQAIEATLGRPNLHAHHAPRTVDLDLLYAGDSPLALPQLTLPHPRLAQRRFVLQPLAEFRPDLILPGQALPVATLLQHLPETEPPPQLHTKDWLGMATGT